MCFGIRITSPSLTKSESRMALGRDQKLHILDLTRSKVQQRGAGPSLSKTCQIMQSLSTSQRVLCCCKSPILPFHMCFGIRITGPSLSKSCQIMHEPRRFMLWICCKKSNFTFLTRVSWNQNYRSFHVQKLSNYAKREHEPKRFMPWICLNSPILPFHMCVLESELVVLLCPKAVKLCTSQIA